MTPEETHVGQVPDERGGPGMDVNVNDGIAFFVEVAVVVLSAGVVAGFVVLPTVWAVGFGAVVVANLLLMYVGPLARHIAQAGTAERR
jgi:hypothetical protein